jgi:hypothetical protein
MLPRYGRNKSEVREGFGRTSESDRGESRSGYQTSRCSPTSYSDDALRRRGAFSFWVAVWVADQAGGLHRGRGCASSTGLRHFGSLRNGHSPVERREDGFLLLGCQATVDLPPAPYRLLFHALSRGQDFPVPAKLHVGLTQLGDDLLGGLPLLLSHDVHSRIREPRPTTERGVGVRRVGMEFNS